VAISYAHKRIAITNLCRPSDVYEDQLEAAANLKQGGYSPLLRALDFYTKQGWVIHVFPWVVGNLGISGLLHPPHICALLQFLEVPHQHWPLAVESTVLTSVNAFYISLSVRFGGPSEGGLCATGRDCAEQEADASDSSDLEGLRAGKGKRSSPWGSSAGAIPRQAPKPKRLNTHGEYHSSLQQARQRVEYQRRWDLPRRFASLREPQRD
jgi:hypothetical protein